MKRLPLLVAAVLLLVTSCSEKVKPGTVAVKREVVTGLALEKVAPSTIDAFYETSGTVAARAVSVIGARTMGNVLSVRVKEGDRVGRGQELAVLDDRDLSHRVVAAEAGYREAGKALEAAEQNRRLAGITYGRYRNLFNEKIISGQEMDQMETQKKVADLEYERARESVNRVRAQLEEMKTMRGFTRIVAPHDGLVIAKKMDEGSLAAPGSPMLLVEDTSRYRVAAPVDQRLAPVLKVGMPVVVVLPDNRRVTGSIGEIVPAIDPGTRSFTVKVDLKDSSLRSGLYARVLLPEGKKQGLLVPAGAVVEKGALTGVYIVDDQGVMAYRMVRTGRRAGERVEVLSGLNEGETIVVSGLDRAIDGGMAKSAKDGR